MLTRMIQGFRPMKLASIDLEGLQQNGTIVWSKLSDEDRAILSKLSYPLLGSIKIDGIRCHVWPLEKQVLSSSNKPIPNLFIRRVLNTVVSYNHDTNMVDGELIVGNTFQSSTSGIMTVEGKPDFTFHVFDSLNIKNIGESFWLRNKRLSSLLNVSKHVKVLDQTVITDVRSLIDFYNDAILKGNEGIVLKHPEGTYKFGRSTFNQGLGFKMKPFSDSEAEIIGFEVMFSNQNEKFTNELGLSKRSSHQENKVALDMLGKFLVKDLKTGVEFKIGTCQGLTQELRKEIWHNQKKRLGKIIKYKMQVVGTKDKPRIPIGLGFRHKEDM